MSTRFQLAQLVERRTLSIVHDAEQLRDSLRTGTSAYQLIVALQDANRAAMRICTYLTNLGEGETKQDDLPNLAEKK